MHELSLCQAIAATVSDHAAGRRVTRVRLRVGHFRQVVPDTLQFCWEGRARDTNLADCQLEIVDVPAIVECQNCTAKTKLDEPILRCGSCASRNVELVSGEEFLIESIDVDNTDVTADDITADDITATATTTTKEHH